MIDIHSHILPGVDDGAKTFTDSVDMIRDLMSMGVTDIIATPHYISETRFISPRRKNRILIEELKRFLFDEKIPVNLYLGNEIYIDANIDYLIKRGEIATMAGSKYLLVELPLNEVFSNYQDILMELMNDGYKVILAHPERYSIVQNDYDIVEELDKIGVLFQCNLWSILGKYGTGAKKTIKKMAKNGMIFALGSDIHYAGNSEKQYKLAYKKLLKYYDKNELNKILVNNPRKIIAG